MISTLIHGEFELGVAAIVGSALFNILVIPGIAGLSSKEQLSANRDLVYKEAQFYMIAVAVLTLTFAFAAIYNPVEAPGSIQGEMTRWLVLMPVALYGLYVFVQYQDTLEHVSDLDTSHIHPGREWIRLLISLIIIAAGVEALVQAAIHFGDIFNTPSFLWGITVVAAGTSVPDAFVSVRAAREGRGITSIANVLGSNTFDLLVCIPAGILIAGAGRNQLLHRRAHDGGTDARHDSAVSGDAHKYGALARGVRGTADPVRRFPALDRAGNVRGSEPGTHTAAIDNNARELSAGRQRLCRSPEDAGAANTTVLG